MAGAPDENGNTTAWGRIAGAVAGLVGLVVATSPAAAAGPLDAPFPPDRPACWGRAYDEAHLARNPRQKTAEIVFGASTRPNSVGDRFYLGYRDRKTPRWRATGSADLRCTPRDGELSCYGECEAFPTRVKAIDARTLQITVEGGECGDEDHFGPDDRVFLLRPLPIDYCATAQWVLGPPEASREDSRPFPPIPTE